MYKLSSSHDTHVMSARTATVDATLRHTVSERVGEVKYFNARRERERKS